MMRCCPFQNPQYSLSPSQKKHHINRIISIVSCSHNNRHLLCRGAVASSRCNYHVLLLQRGYNYTDCSFTRMNDSGALLGKRIRISRGDISHHQKYSTLNTATAANSSTTATPKTIINNASESPQQKSPITNLSRMPPGFNMASSAPKPHELMPQTLVGKNSTLSVAKDAIKNAQIKRMANLLQENWKQKLEFDANQKNQMFMKELEVYFEEMGVATLSSSELEEQQDEAPASDLQPADETQQKVYHQKPSLSQKLFQSVKNLLFPSAYPQEPTQSEQKQHLMDYIENTESENQEEQMDMLHNDVLFQRTLPDSDGQQQITPVGILEFLKTLPDPIYATHVRQLMHHSKEPYAAILKYLEDQRYTHPRILVLWGYIQQMNLKEPALSFKTMVEAASRQEPEAHHQLSIHYYHGIGTKMDRAKSLRHLQMAAHMNYPPALNQLGVLYRNFSPQQTLHLFTQAAEMRDVQSMLDLGMLYLTGDCVALDYSRAFYWLEQAYEAGHPAAAAQLGLCYLNGYGVQKNPSEALKFFMEGIRVNDTTSVLYLGVAFEEGLGSKPNPEFAAKLYTIGANNYEVECVYRLASCMERGFGLERNVEEAYRLYIEAAQNQDQEAALAALRLQTSEGFALTDELQRELMSIADPSALQEVRTVKEMKSIRKRKKKASLQKDSSSSSSSSSSESNDVKEEFLEVKEVSEDKK